MLPDLSSHLLLSGTISDEETEQQYIKQHWDFKEIPPDDKKWFDSTAV
jgi:hypothetical protein